MVPLAVLVIASSASSCAATLGALGVGYERGKADVVADKDGGIAFLERRPRVGSPADVVVMLHGFGGNKDHWTRFCAHMPEELWLIAPDLPGFGESTKDPSLSYDLRSQAERLRAFLKRRGVTRFHLLGNSLGGELAVNYALAHPGDVESLVLFDPSGIPSPKPSPMDALTKQGNEPLLIKDAAGFDRLMKMSFVKPPAIPDFLKAHFAAEAAAGYEMAKKISADIHKKDKPIEGEVEKLEPPTLVVWGDTDRLIDPSVVPLWRARLPGHDVVVMRETGHAPMIERPAESAALVLKWWQRAGLLGGTAPAAAP